MNIFIDTNVFLSFYSLSNDDLEEINKMIVLLKKEQVKLYVPSQVIDEFKRNRENKISEAITKLKENRRNPQYPQFCKDYEEYNQAREIYKEYDKIINALIKRVEEDINNNDLKADHKIKQLFESSEIIPVDDEILLRSRRRLDLGNPPGKKGSLGDALNWECLLSKVPNDEDIHFVCDDKDYYSLLGKDEIKDYLKDEWFNVKGSDIHIYRRLSKFFKDHYPDIKLAADLEIDYMVDKLVSSGSFSETHDAISDLGHEARFSSSQVKRLGDALVSNSQISMIRNDTDVKFFYSKLMSEYPEAMSEEAIALLS